MEGPQEKPSDLNPVPYEGDWSLLSTLQRLFRSRVKSCGALLSPFPQNLETTRFQ